MTDDIVAGSVVELKSGGPNMTVVQVDDVGSDYPRSAYCAWFKGGVVNFSSFPIFALKLVEDMK